MSAFPGVGHITALNEIRNLLERRKMCWLLSRLLAMPVTFTNPNKSYLVFLCLSFLFCKMEIVIISSISWVVGRIQWDDTCEKLRATLSTG